MKTPLLYLLEALFCSGLLLALYRLLLVRRIPFAAARRYLVASVLLSAVIPALEIPVYPARTVVYPLPLIRGGEPAEFGEIPEAGEFGASVAAGTEAPGREAAVDWPRVARTGVRVLYGAVTALLVAGSVARVVSICRLRRRARRTLCGDYVLAEHAEVRSPFSFLRTVFLGEGYEGRRREIVIRHEASHVRHRHTVERLAVEAVLCLFWFNPFVWMARRWLAEVHEWEADRDVLDAGCDLTEYRTILFCQLFGYNPDIVSGLNHSLTKNRFAMMTQSFSRRRALLRLAAVLPVLAGLVMLCGFTTRSAAEPAASEGRVSRIHISKEGIYMNGELRSREELLDFVAEERAKMGAATTLCLTSDPDLPAPDLSDLEPTPVLEWMTVVSADGSSAELKWLPVDEKHYRKQQGRTVTPDGRDITDWALKHYFVKARRPMFVVDGRLLTAAGYAARTAAEGTGRHGAEREMLLYTGPEVGARVGDPEVDALLVCRAASASGAAAPDTECRAGARTKLQVSSQPVIACSADGGVRLDGKSVTLDELEARIGAMYAALAPERRHDTWVVISAEAETPVRVVNDIRERLRRAGALRVRYADPAGRSSRDVARMLPPAASRTGAEVLRVVPDTDAEESDRGEVRIRACNRYMVVVNGRGEVLGGVSGRLRPLDAEALAADIAAFLRNEAGSPEWSEHRTELFALPDGREISYGVSRGIVTIQTKANTAYDRYLAVQQAVSDAFGALRDVVARTWFGRPFAALDEAGRQAVMRAVPLKVSEAEPRE